MKKCTLCFLILFVMSLSVFAQRRTKEMDPDRTEEREMARSNSDTKSFAEKLTYGGNFAVGFGNVRSTVFIQPLVGYRATEKTMFGTGFTYIYWSEKYLLTNGTRLEFSDNLWGLNFFARQVLFSPLFAHAEYQPTNFTSYNRLGDSKRVWSNPLYLGGGINQSFNNGQSGAYILIVYDVLWQDRSIDPTSFSRSFMPSPWDIRFGILF